MEQGAEVLLFSVALMLQLWLCQVLCVLWTAHAPSQASHMAYLMTMR